MSPTSHSHSHSRQGSLSVSHGGTRTPSILSRAGSPVQPLGNEKTLSRKSSSSDIAGAAHSGFAGLGFSAVTRELKVGEFIGALDCGTTSSRFIIFDEQAKIITEHQAEYPQSYPHAGWHEQSPADLVDSMTEVMTKAMEKLEFLGWHRDSVKGIGITNQRETTVCWSKSTGKALCPAIVWDDSRTVHVVQHFEDKLTREGFTYEAGSASVRVQDIDGLVAITGTPLSTYFSAIKLRWMLDHHKAVAQAYADDDLSFGTVDSWLVYNLTGAAEGGLHVVDVTNASRTLLMDISTLSWSPSLVEFFGFKPSILPRIVSSAEVYGTVSAKLGTSLTGVPIAGIVGDQQAALVGNKCLARGDAKITYGTGAFVLFNTGDEIVYSKHGLLTTVGYQAGPGAKPAYALEGSIAVAGSAIKWLRDQIGIIAESSDMDGLAGSVKDNGGVYFVTAFAGLLAPYWDRTAAGTIIGLTAYSSKAHIARATLEAMSFQSLAVLGVIERQVGVKLETLKVDGGVTNSDLAMQLQANIGGFTVCRPAMRESTALGAALCAAHALGLFGWDLNRPETLAHVNMSDAEYFYPQITEKARRKLVRGWERAVERAQKWREDDESEEEDESEE